MKKRTAPRGFTLLEIVIVIALTAVLMMTIFQALAKVRENEARTQQKKDEEKSVYLLFHRLGDLFKNRSSFTVFNGRDETVYFRGSSSGAVFLSRAPLVSPYRGVHFVELRFVNKKILYREKIFRQEKPGDPISFEQLKEEPFLPLLEEVEQAAFQYFGWDNGARNFLWKSNLNSFEKDTPPDEILLRVTYRGKGYELIFPKVIIDKNEEVPVDLFR